MAEEELPEETPPPAEPRRRPLRRFGKWVLGGLLALAALIVVGLIVLNSPIGKRFVTDQIAQVAPASGLRFEVGRIEGDIFGKAVLHDVVAYDPKGEFLTIPVVELDWRPLSWLTSGLDIRNLVARRGTLLRVPELLPGDPDAPILPDFDIRVDRFELDDFIVAPGVVDEDAHVANLIAQADIRDGRVMAKADGEFGDRDRLHLLVDAEPDGDKFDIDLDYIAPRGGVIAGLIGAEAGYEGRIRGAGLWSNWRGALYITRDNERFAAFRLTNRSGRYGIVGQAWPGPAAPGLIGKALGQPMSLAAFGTLEDSVLDGEFALRGGAIEGEGAGIVDLAGNSFDEFRIVAQMRDPELFGEGLRLEGARLAATLDGDFQNLAIEHSLQIDALVSGETRITRIEQKGTATYDGTRWLLPLDTEVARIETGSTMVDPRLVDGKLGGTLAYTGSRLTADRLEIAFVGATARLALRGDTAKGVYALAGPVAANGLALENVGTLNAGAKIVFTYADNWKLRADFDGRIPDVTNATLANIAGPAIAFRGGASLGGGRPIDLRDIHIGASKLKLALDGQVVDGRTTIAGSGDHTDYGDFTVEAALTEAGPEAELVFANPYPAAGLKDVRVAIAPIEEGFAIDTEGQSTLGPFAGKLGLYAPEGGPTRIAVERFDVWKTAVTGDITLGDAGVSGALALSGGGLDGAITLVPRGGGQGFDVALRARNASFGGETPISIARARIDGSGLLVDGNSDIEASVFAKGVSYGNMFLGRVAANAELTNGSGTVTASLAGRRGSRLALQLNAGIAPERITAIARGEFGGQRISMPRRAVLVKQGDGGWRLAQTQLSYGQGIVLAQGEFGGGETAMELQLSDMPLSLADLASADLGLGGTISGLVDFRTDGSGVPTGSARVMVDDLTRSGLVLTSKPVDFALVARLTLEDLEARAVIEEGGEQRGRLQARIADLGRTGGLYERLEAGDLFAQLRYSGPAAALWRLAAIDAFDLTGPLGIAANVSGSLSDPQVRGSVASDNLRVRSGLSGTDVRNVTARGSFAGSRLRLTRFAGVTGDGGKVSGSGIVDLARMGQPIEGRARAFRGPALDLRIAADNASLLDSNGLAATVTGPLRIVSNGIGGTIAGRLSVNKARWRLGSATAASELPQIRTREINTPADIAPIAARGDPWRYLIDARAPSRIAVSGMGLDSEWSANVRLRGTTSDPRIGGEARVVRGAYSFAGTRFELTRGIIEFDENVPIDPRLDIVAETEKDDLDVTVNVGGSAVRPEITFSSTPSLPEEEILSRLLFGGSITELSATDALQLGAAVASLRGGGGMDPINKLRSAIGLDRLRIVAADPALNRETGVALGKNIGRRTYIEIVTDGRGYSATQVEFRVTGWVSLLGTISTIGRDSVAAEISKDY
jgi:translocation and assembly module TamB